jgi:sugar phosphate isomerase/epimerase
MLSLSPLTVLPCSPIEQIDAAFEAGFDAVGLRLVPTLDTDIDVLADSALMRAIRDRLTATRLQVLEIQVVRIGPDTDVAAVRPMLSFGRDIGARHLVVTSLPRCDWDSANEDVVAARLHELCELAVQYRMRPAIEFMASRGIATIEDAIRIAGKTGHENIGICIDALHLFRSGGTVASLSKLDPWVLSWVDLCDAPIAKPGDEGILFEARFNRLYPGEGELPLRELVAAIPVDVPLSVEVPCLTRSMLPAAGRAREAARRTRELLGLTPSPSFPR